MVESQTRAAGDLHTSEGSDFGKLLNLHQPQLPHRGDEHSNRPALQATVEKQTTLTKCPECTQLMLVDGSLGHKSEAETNLKAIRIIQAIYRWGRALKWTVEFKFWPPSLQAVGPYRGSFPHL